MSYKSSIWVTRTTSEQCQRVNNSNYRSCSISFCPLQREWNHLVPSMKPIIAFITCYHENRTIVWLSADAVKSFFITRRHFVNKRVQWLCGWSILCILAAEVLVELLKGRITKTYVPEHLRIIVSFSTHSQSYRQIGMAVDFQQSA